MQAEVSSEPLTIDKQTMQTRCGYFITPNDVGHDGINDYTKIVFPKPYSIYYFKSADYSYLYFEDDVDWQESDVRDILSTGNAIQDISGHLCRAIDDTDGVYGVSIDHDPFHDGYSYLWCCGDQAKVIE